MSAAGSGTDGKRRAKKFVTSEFFRILATGGVLSTDVFWSYLTTRDHTQVAIYIGDLPGYKPQHDGKSIRVKSKLHLTDGAALEGVVIAHFADGFVVQRGDRVRMVPKDRVSFVEILPHGGRRTTTHRVRRSKSKSQSRRRNRA